MQLKRSQSFFPYRLAFCVSLSSAIASIGLIAPHPAVAVPQDESSQDESSLRQLPAEPVTAEAFATEWPAEDDIPEEILRTEIITEARSPLTGEVLSAAEYAQLQATLAGSAGDPLVSDDLKYLIFLLQFRRAVSPLIPFL